MKLPFDAKKIIAITASILCVALCVGVIYFNMSKKKYGTYETPENSNQADTSSLNSSNVGSNLNTQQDGKSISVKTSVDVPGDLDISVYVKRAYELQKYLAVDSFVSLDSISVDQAVQYAFCYIFTEGKCLVDSDVGNMVYRQASKQEIEAQITNLFGSCPYDVTKSNLYNSASGNFEMWQPNYSSTVYASADVSSEENGVYTISTDYYESAGKKKKTSTANIKVSKASNGTYFISGIS